MEPQPLKSNDNPSLSPQDSHSSKTPMVVAGIVIVFLLITTGALAYQNMQMVQKLSSLENQAAQVLPTEPIITTTQPIVSPQVSTCTPFPPCSLPGANPQCILDSSTNYCESEYPTDTPSGSSQQSQTSLIKESVKAYLATNGILNATVGEPNGFFGVPDTYSVSYYEDNSGAHGGAFYIVQKNLDTWNVLEPYSDEYCMTIERSTADENDRAFLGYTDHCL